MIREPSIRRYGVSCVFVFISCRSRSGLSELSIVDSESEKHHNPNFARKARELASPTRSSSNRYGEIFLCVFRKKLTLLFLRIPRTARRTAACTSTQASEPPFGLHSLPTSLLLGCSTWSSSIVSTRTSSLIRPTLRCKRLSFYFLLHDYMKLPPSRCTP